MMKARLIFSLLTISCLFFSCKKENSDKENTCFDIPPGPGIGYEYVYEGRQFLFPIFNPKNSNEFLYLERNYTTGEAGLYIYNLQSGNKVKIFNGIVTAQPNWSRNDIITFCSTISGKAWKVNSDGSGLTELPIPGAVQYLKANLAGDSFLVNTFYDNDYHVLLLNEQGDLLDSITNPFSLTDATTWLNPTYVAFPTYNLGMAIRNLSTGEVRSVYENGSNFNVSYFATTWMDEHHIIASHKKGIYLMDIDRKTASLLVNTCESEHYYSLSYSAQRNIILVQRENLKYPVDGVIKVVNSIVAIDLERNMIYALEIR